MDHMGIKLGIVPSDRFQAPDTVRISGFVVVGPFTAMAHSLRLCSLRKPFYGNDHRPRFFGCFTELEVHTLMLHSDFLGFLVEIGCCRGASFEAPFTENKVNGFNFLL